MPALTLPGSGVLPHAFIAPKMRVLYWPLDTGSSVITGGVSPGGFNRHGAPFTSIDAPMTLTVSSGSVSWHPSGGLVFPGGGAGTAFAEYNPGPGSARDFMAGMLNLETMIEGERIIAWCDLITPAGWQASKTVAECLICVGDLNQTATARGYSFELTSTEVPQATYAALGRTSGTPSGITPSGGTAVGDSARTFVGWELAALEDGAATMRMRTHVLPEGGTLGSSSWSVDVNMVDTANGGTGVPGLTATTGVRVGRRNRGGTQNQVFWGERVRCVGLARLDADQQG